MVIADKNGNTPLHFAAKSGQASLVAQLVSSGDDPNAQNKDGNSPLHIAYMHGNTEAALLMVKAGADGNLRNLENKTPRDYIREA